MTKSDALHLELNDNENATYKAPWDSTKTVHGGKIVALNTYIRKKTRIKAMI